jgi:hypothetical protein
VFSFVDLRAWTTSSTAMPYELRRSGLRMTWYCFVSPPVGMTCDTPGTARRRFRRTQSAVVFSSMGSCLSDVSAMKRISPMIEEMGASVGRSAPGGSDEAASWSFSATICRAW